MFCLIQIILIKSWLESTCCWHFILKIYGCEKLFSPEIVIFFHFFSIFMEPKKSLWFFSCYQYFQKLPLLLYLAILYFVFFCHVCLFISMLFSINPNRNIRSSSQIRQNSQVFHYSWFIAKWAHVLGKLSNMIQAFSTFCSGEKFPFQTSQSTIQNS